MHIYNTTFCIDNSLYDEFISWLKQEFIPTAVADDGQYFNRPELLRINTQTEPGTSSLALHLRTDSVDNINLWYEDHGSRLFDHILTRWSGRVVFFSTTLDIIEDDLG